MKPKLSLLACVGSVLCLSVQAVCACTWFTFLSDERHCFVARTFEWPNDMNGEVTQVPRGHDFGEFRAKYGFVGMTHKGFFSDGMNENGVTISGMWLGESKYPAQTKGAMHIRQLIPLVLGNAQTVDDALKLIKENVFYSSPMDITSGLEVTIHFAITEPSGRAVVVEFLDGKTTVFENKAGVMTNDPNYKKHMEIWSKYDPKHFSEDTFASFDYSPEGRFCRMAAINATQAAVPDDISAVNRAWSMVNCVDIPQGILYWRWVSPHPQFTAYSIVGDLHNRVYYFRTYTNYDIRKIELGKIDFAKVKYATGRLFSPADYQEFRFK